MTQSRHRRIAILGTALHLGLAAGLFVQYLIVVPSAKKTFDEFGLTLPWITLSLIRISNWFVEYWWAAAPFVILLASGQFVLLSKRSDGPWYKVAWIAIVGMLLAMTVFTTWFAMELPMVKLREGLAK